MLGRPILDERRDKTMELRGFFCLRGFLYEA